MMGKKKKQLDIDEFFGELDKEEEWVIEMPDVEAHDAVEHPSHYTLFADGWEVVDVIRSSLTTEEFLGWCKGNWLKYRLRAGEKGPAEECIAKSEVFLNWANDNT
jgi:hypothetical protein